MAACANTGVAVGAESNVAAIKVFVEVISVLHLSRTRADDAR
jgi:hypothetical protein